MKYDHSLRAKAAELFGMGLGCKSTASLLGIPAGTVEKWHYTYRALGEEALFMTKHKTYSFELKLAAVRDLLQGGLTKAEVMEKHGIASVTALERWARCYRRDGAGALAPKPKGRPVARPAAYASREEELEARIRELELELEIQKRLNALADGTERRQHQS